MAAVSYLGILNMHCEMEVLSELLSNEDMEWISTHDILKCLQWCWRRFQFSRGYSAI